jgi:carboxymethylenebutenolidase
MWQSPTQGEPLDAVGTPGAAPTLVLAGTADPWVGADGLVALEDAGVEVVRYEGADHGFAHDPNRPAHRPDDAADAWSRAIAHLLS